MAEHPGPDGEDGGGTGSGNSRSIIDATASNPGHSGVPSSSNGAAPRESRRASFRRAHIESDLPPDFLDTLEKKRKQLDESIHKYIANKEREFKNFERDLRQQVRLSHIAQDASNNGAHGKGSSSNGEAAAQRLCSGNENGTTSGARRPAENAGESGSPASVVHKTKTEHHDHASDSKSSLGSSHGKDKDGQVQSGRAASAPELATGPDALLQVERSELGRNSTGGLGSAKPKRPDNIGRTSSSGSSADGKLTSAMKSPSQRPKGKRVSIQVGGEIVVPSAPVPQAMDHHSSSSHSRARAAERDSLVSPNDAMRSPPPEAIPIRSPPPNPIPQASRLISTPEESEETSLREQVLSEQKKENKRPATNSKNDIDPDGDLFDLEAEEHMLDRVRYEDFETPPLLDEEEITGRTASPPGLGTAAPAGGSPIYDPESGLILPDETVVQTDFGASQQPANSGYRQPSVISDPVLSSPAYELLEHEAVAQDMYGSSFSRPFSKGSFTPGSLGESYMEENAKEMQKLRSARQQTKGKP